MWTARTRSPTPTTRSRHRPHDTAQRIRPASFPCPAPARREHPFVDRRRTGPRTIAGVAGRSVVRQ
ncbi:MAG TPA: hypothetical protein DCX91_07775, partial [Stenotrophomonas sp.]|nr:hypothetical protein [Stenotrophomonas sp.]